MKSSRKITVSITIISGMVLVLALCQLLGVWKNAIYVYEPLMGIVLLLQAVLFWNKSRRIAVFELIAAILVLGMAAYILLIK